jgi:hypothetical protein
MTNAAKNIFGFSTEPSNGEEYIPILKYHALTGRLSRIDKKHNGTEWVKEEVDLTRIFKAKFDLENIETGWLKFAAGSAPEFQVVPLGQVIPDRPSPLHHNGVRVMVELSKECAGGEKAIREFANNSKAFSSGFEKLVVEYNAEKGKHPGLLPVVVMEGSTPRKSGTGATQSTHYVPVFTIVGWVPRGDLLFVPKTPKLPNPPTPPATAPDTGSTKVGAPSAKAPALEDDFG